MAYDTAANIINSVAVEVGLIPFSGKVTDPFASSDPNFGQLCQLLTSVGRDLIRETEWSALQQSWAFTTVTNTGRYAFPPDYDRFIGSTQWNRTNRLPLGGPLSPQQFERLKAGLAGVVFNVLFRQLQGQFQAYPDTGTPGAYNIGYEYVSRNWVVPGATQAAYQANANWAGSWQPGVTYAANAFVSSGGNVYKTTAGGVSGANNPTGTGSPSDGTVAWVYQAAAGQDSSTDKADVIQFDPQLVLRALVLAYKRVKGMDTAAAQADFNFALESAKGADKPAGILSLGSVATGYPLIGDQNIPITGFGV